MDEQKKKLFLKYGITTAIVLGFSALILYLNDFFTVTGALERYRLLADAFTVPGVLLLCVGALIWVSTDGLFDGITYAAKRLGSLIPFYSKNYKHEKYYDYVMRKRGKRISGYGFILIVGAAFTAIGIIFTILFYMSE